MSNAVPVGYNKQATAELAVKDYLRIITLRKWWLIAFFIVGTSAAIIYSKLLPNLYRSTTVILVERQTIPESYVQAIITSPMQDRLNTISQQIMSRKNLENIIMEFSPYKNEDFAPLMHRFYNKFKNLTNIDIEKYATEIGLSKEQSLVTLEEMIDRLKNNIEVKVIGGNNAFSVSYIGVDPHTVMDITNTLATLYIDENLKIRERQAEGTSEFLANELIGSKKELEGQEEILKDFKSLHMGSLPEQMDTNLRTLDRLQIELQALNTDLKNSEARKFFYEQQLKEYERELAERQLQGSALPLISAPSADTQAVALERLKEELTSLQARFNENYPDVLLHKKQIRELEAQLAAGSSRPTPEGKLVNNLPVKPRTPVALPQNIRAQIQNAQSETELLRERQKRTIAMIKDYEKRVESTFTNNQRLLDITRDYEMSQRNYQALLQKRLNAKISENLEKRQQAERFRILDPANLPQKPYKPNRPYIILLGSLISISLGVGCTFVKEFFNPLYRKPDDLHSTLSFPTLVTIPYSKSMQKKPRSLITIKEPNSILSEQYRVLFTRIMQLYDSRPHPTFAISSSLKGEGKTVTALNLAVVSARDFGKKTLLIECDFRNPSILDYLELEVQEGLAEILLNGSSFQSSIITFGSEQLSILPVRRSITNSSLILSSQCMKDLIMTLKERYDFIFMDSPPIISLPDMNIIENLIDGVILVVKSESTPRNTLQLAIRSLNTPRLVGIVLNDVRQTSLPYYQYYAEKV